MKKTLYILQNGELHRRDNSLYFESKRGRKFIPVENTSDICIFGDVKVSKRFLDFSSQKQICIHYFDIFGAYVGTYYPREYYNSGYTIVKQVEYYLNEEKRTILAKSIANGYVDQKLRVIKYYSNRKSGKSQENLENLATQLEKARKALSNENTLKGIISVVKKVDEEYNKGFDFIFNNIQFIDNGNKNSIAYKRKTNLVQFGESIGQAMVLGEIYKTHLDPRIGYFHETDFSSFALCLDVFYIFNPIMIHRLIFTLVNKSIITKKDFEEYKRDIILSKKGKGKFIKEFDKRMRTTIKHRHLGRYVSYRRLIRLELYKIQKHIIEGKNYKPYQALW